MQFSNVVAKKKACISTRRKGKQMNYLQKYSVKTQGLYVGSPIQY